jgi:proline dehydrogenase
VRALANSGQDFCVGTHDPDLIVWATVKMQEHPERMEFGSLKGLADQTRLDFIKNKWRVSEYVPFGSNRAAYEERRRTYLRNIERLGRTTTL